MIERISVYLAAHQDDWLLFMEPNVSRDLKDPKCRVLIIHTTAGDAGMNSSHWKSREVASINSLHFRLLKKINESNTVECLSVLDKKIHFAEIENIGTYFLRLPDGGMEGNGFESNDYHSLAKICQGSESIIKSVDGLNEYHSYQEISSVIRQIIDRESQLIGISDKMGITLHIPEFDRTLNPGDHSDHYFTGLLSNEPELTIYSPKFAYVHYEVLNSAHILGAEDLFWKTGMFIVYHQTVLNLTGYSTIDESPLYLNWCTKRSVSRQL